MEGDTQAHWDTVYGTKALVDVSWYEAEPTTSVRLITSAGSLTEAVVDVGAGASFLADALLTLGYGDVTALDVSAQALATVRGRLGDHPGARFVVTDVLAWKPARQYSVWHDRAAFHFLTDHTAARAYADVAAVAVRPGGALVVGAFAHDGPSRCSGLPTARYTPEALAGHFAGDFDEQHREREQHVTPAGVAQSLTWVVLRRK